MAYRVFISFKNLDRFGSPTPDSRIAAELYHRLRALGIEVFFSNEEVQRKKRSDYGDLIDEALESSRILLLVGSRTEYINAKWIKYEWDGFKNEINSGRKDGVIIPVLDKNLDIGKLPFGLRRCQVYTFEQLDRAVDMTAGELRKKDAFSLQTVFPATVPAAKAGFPAAVQDAKAAYPPTVQAKAAGAVKRTPAAKVSEAEGNPASCVRTRRNKLAAAIGAVVLILIAAMIFICGSGNAADLQYEFYKGYSGYEIVNYRDNLFSGDIVLPDSYNGNPVVGIEWRAFDGCKYLDSVTIPEGITSIGRSAFYNCENLSQISIPESMEYIGSDAFSGCTVTVTAPHEPEYYGCTPEEGVTWVTEE